jgi:hypothetical protein
LQRFNVCRQGSDLFPRRNELCTITTGTETTLALLRVGPKTSDGSDPIAAIACWTFDSGLVIDSFQHPSQFLQPTTPRVSVYTRSVDRTLGTMAERFMDAGSAKHVLACHRQHRVQRQVVTQGADEAICNGIGPVQEDRRCDLTTWVCHGLPFTPALGYASNDTLSYLVVRNK